MHTTESICRPSGLTPRWHSFWVLLPVLALSSSLSSGAEGAATREYQLKAAFLYNFAKFIQWPAHRFGAANSPIVLGVFGKNPFGAELANVVEDRTINGREMVVRSVQSVAALGAVHVLFVSETDDSRLGELDVALRGVSVLTVGESEAFVRHGGIIRFVLEGDKLRFQINMEGADRAGLKISSQLQKLAQTVQRKP